MITYNDQVEIYTALADRPTADEYGMGACVAAGIAYTSDGVATWTANGKFQTSAAPTAMTVTASLTIDGLLTGIVTDLTTVNPVTLTLPTGALTDAGLPVNFPINMSFDWSLINLGNQTVTVAASTTTHLFVGLATLATITSGLFRTRKTAADTFTTYRIA